MLGLTLKYFKYNKKKIIYSIFIIIFSLTSIVSISIAARSQRINITALMEKYGKQYGAEARGVDFQTVEKIRKFERVKEAYYKSSAQPFIDSIGNVSMSEVLSKELMKLDKLTLSKGNFPTNDNEVLLFDSTHKYKIGDFIEGNIKHEYKTKDGKNEISYDSYKVKVVGLLSNKVKSADDKDLDTIYFKKLKTKPTSYDVYMNFKTGFKDTEGESYKLNIALNLVENTIIYNKIQANLADREFEKMFDSLDSRILGLTVVLFPLVFLLVCSRNVFKDAGLLRTIGASRKQVYFIFGLEKIFIAVLGNILSFITTYILSLYYIRTSNFTLFSEDVFNIMDKNIHLSIKPFLIAFLLTLIPYVVVFLYEIYVISKNSPINLSRRNNKIAVKVSNNKKKRVAIESKLLRTNILSNLVYLAIPAIMLSLCISRYVDNINVDYFNENPDPLLKDFYNREYKLTLLPNKDKSVLKLTRDNIDRLKEIKGVSSVVSNSSDDIFIISDGDLFNKGVLNGGDKKGIEVLSTMTSIDDKLFNEFDIPKIDINKKGKLPIVYVRKGVYSKLTQDFTNVFKRNEVGKEISIKVPIYKNGKQEYRVVKCEVGGYIEDQSWNDKVQSQLLKPEIIVSMDNLEKIRQGSIINSIEFNYSGDKPNKELDSIFGKDNYMLLNRDEENRKNSSAHFIFVKMLLINIIYITILSIVTIYSSLSMVFEQRRKENSILRALGLSKKGMLMINTKESIFWGVLSGVITVVLVLESEARSYLVHMSFGMDYKFVFSYQTAFLATLYVVFMYVILFGIVMAKEKRENNYRV